MPKLGYKHPMEKKRKKICVYCKHEGLKKFTFVAMGYSGHLMHKHPKIWAHGKRFLPKLSPIDWPDFPVRYGDEDEIISVGLPANAPFGYDENGSPRLNKKLYGIADDPNDLPPFTLPSFTGRMILRDATGAPLAQDLYPQWVKDYNAQEIDMMGNQLWKITATWNGASEANTIKIVDKPPDLINHPPHYTFGKYEVIDVLEDWFSKNPHLWNAVAYLARADKKGEEIQDLEKAIWYIRRKIATLKGDENE